MDSTSAQPMYGFPPIKFDTKRIQDAQSKLNKRSKNRPSKRPTDTANASKDTTAKPLSIHDLLNQ